MSSLAKSTVIVTIFNLLGITFVFISNVIIARIFGAGVKMDIYLASNALPLFIITIISSALNVTFIPIFAEYRSKDNNDVWKIVSSILNISCLITVTISVIVIVLAKPLMQILTPGFNTDKIKIAVTLLRIQIPIIILAVINELMVSIYYSNKRFITPLLNKVISPLITILYVLIFSRYISIQSLAFATLTAMLVQTLILSAGFRNDKEFRYYWIFQFRNPGVIKIYKLMIPLLGGMIFYKIIPLFDRFFASKLPDGSISYLGYSFKIFSQIPPLISTGIAISIFPILAALAAKKDWAGLISRMSLSIRFVLFLSTPVVIMLCLYSRPLIELVFQRGAFGISDTFNTSHALSIYIIALPFVVVGDIVSKGFYVLQDTWTPAIIGVFEVIVYCSAAYFFLPGFGFLAIPIAYVVYVGSASINAYFVRKKLGNKGGGKIIISFFKYAAVAIFSAMIIYWPVHVIESVWVETVLVFCGFCIYFIVSIFLLKTEEARNVYYFFLKRINVNKMNPPITQI